MKQQIVFRADGGKKIGLGHIMRSLSLANYLNGEFVCSFATTNTDPQIHHAIRQSCQKIIQLPSSKNHFHVFLEQLEGKEIVVLDNYYYSTEYQKQIKDKGCALVCIDDNQDKHFVADIIINHAEGVEKEKYSVESFAKVLLGYKYALIKPEFINHASLRDNIEVRDILICVGGADPFNISKKVVEALSDDLRLRIHLVLGAAYPHKESLQNIVANQQINTYYNLLPSKLADLMKKSDFGILPASTVAIEACAARLPFATGYYVDNQVQIYKGLLKAGLAYDLGNFVNLSQEILSSTLASYIHNKEQTNQIRKRQREMFDGNIQSRYLALFKELAKG